MGRIFQGAVEPGRKHRQAGVSGLCRGESGINEDRGGDARTALKRMKKAKMSGIDEVCTEMIIAVGQRRC